MRLFSFILVTITLVGCGGDETTKTAPSNPANPAAPAPAPGAKAGSGSGVPLPFMLHAEDRVECPAPHEGSPTCDPNATKPVPLKDNEVVEHKPGDLWCEGDNACILTTKGYLCGPCPERIAIRHQFRDRDFVPDVNRDPFQSAFVKVGSGSGSGSDDAMERGRCGRGLRVTNYSYLDLKLVGIVSQGTQRKVLMMSPDNRGHIIRRGDCVGKEKAWVKEILDNVVCFEPPDDSDTTRTVEPKCVELHSKQIPVTSLPGDNTDVAPAAPLPVPKTTPGDQQPTPTTTP